MLSECLVYIRKPGRGEAFVGCGALVEQNVIVTCRHVWRDAGQEGEAIFPHIRRGGVAATSLLKLVDACEAKEGDDPDVVLLRAIDPPEGLTALQIARAEDYETGEAHALARIPTRGTDREIPGEIGRHVDAKGRRAFSGKTATGYWLEKGSSGSPLFVGAGQQLAGLISMAELGDEPQNAPVREAYVVPGTIIWSFVKALAQRELDARQRAIQEALQKESQAAEARELILEIARRSRGDAAASFEQALANARAAFEEGLKAIAIGTRGGNTLALVNDLLKRLAERTRLGDFAGGAAEADSAFSDWRKMEAERRAESIAAGTRILSEGARQDILGRKFRAAAERIACIVDLEQPNPSARFRALRGRQNEIYVEGRNKGSNASLEVAIELARLELKAAGDFGRARRRSKRLGHSA